MSDEEAMFEVWFQLYRQKRWKASRPDLAQEPVSKEFMMGLRDDFLTGWLARATLHVTPGESMKREGR